MTSKILPAPQLSPPAVVGNQCPKVPLAFLGTQNGHFSGGLKPVCICATPASSFCSTHPLICPCHPSRRPLGVAHLTPAHCFCQGNSRCFQCFHSLEAWFLARQEKSWHPCQGPKQLCLTAVLQCLKYFYQQLVLTSSPLSIKIKLTPQG